MEQIVKILAVDDRPANLFALEASLDVTDVEVVKASSGNEALSLMLEHDFALVLLDVQMPHMDGFEAAELMRSNPSTRHIPIIFVTAISTEQKHVFKGYEAGAVDYLFKPIDPEILNTKVAIFCDLYRLKKKAEVDRQMLETTLQCIADGVVATDVDGMVTFMNPVAESLCGQQASRSVGKPVSQVLRICELEDFSAEIDISAQHNLFAAEHGKIEVALSRTEEKIVPVELSISPIIDSSKNTRGLIITFCDISQRIEAEKERSELFRKLRQSQKMEAIGTLAGGIAHDFNNILTPILGYAELTLDKFGENDDLRHNLSELLKAANRAKDLVQQILTFSRHQEKFFASIHVQSIVKETVKLLRSTLPSTITVQASIDTDCGPILADPTQIHQVVMNLCTNAYHAMGDDGGVLTISLSQLSVSLEDTPEYKALSPGDYVKLSVGDTGTGISSDLHDRIFEPYYTTKGVGVGTGMGLAMVHSIVDEHNGHIVLESTVGMGTTFDVYFPVSSGESPTEVVLKHESLPHGNGTILVVDDEEPIVRLLGRMLDQIGYRYTSFTSSAEALADFSSSPARYDLVVTDQTMPEMTGVEFAEKIHAVRPDIPIVLCSGYSNVINEENASESGVTYLGKPVTTVSLAKTLYALLKPLNRK